MFRIKLNIINEQPSYIIYQQELYNALVFIFYRIPINEGLWNYIP